MILPKFFMLRSQRGKIYFFLLFLIVLFLDSAVFAQREKLPISISDPVQSEALPVISADGKRLFFTRAREGYDGSTVFDVWRSFVDRDGSFKDPDVLGGHLLSRFSIAVTSVSPDNNTLYLIGKLHADTPPEDRLMISHREKNGWSKPLPIRIRSLNPHGLTEGYLAIDYAFGPDERTLILAMQSDSALGGKDLYVSFFDEHANEWTAPLWLGTTINSGYNEITPYLAADTKTLYFSSDRPGGIGDLDVYRSVRLDSTWKHWSEPENIGSAINHPGRTSYYTEDAQGKYAYFVWHPDSRTQTDIYRAPAPKRENNVTLLRGKVLDETGTPVSAEIRYESLSDGKTLGMAQSDPESGSFQITLPSGERYSLHAEKSGYLPTTETFDATKATGYSTIEKNLTLVKIKENAVIRLNAIFFETDKTELLRASDAELDRLAGILLKDASIHISIEGHTDNSGSEVHNKALSLGRANAVREYLIQKGIAESRLQAIAFASEKPIASNDSEEGRSKNRRVEFRIIKIQ